MNTVPVTESERPGLRGKLVCLLIQMEVPDNNKDTILLGNASKYWYVNVNMAIFRKLRIDSVL